MATSIAPPATAKASICAYIVPSKLLPHERAERHPDERGERGDHGRSHPHDVAEGLHRERIEIPEDEADAEESGEQVGHEEPEWRKYLEGEGQRPCDGRTQCDAHRRRPREAAHPMLHHQSAVHERGAPEGEKQQSEPEREESPGAIGIPWKICWAVADVQMPSATVMEGYLRAGFVMSAWLAWRVLSSFAQRPVRMSALGL